MQCILVIFSDTPVQKLNQPVANYWTCVLLQVDYATDSVSAALKRPDIFSPLAYLPHLQLHRKQQTWFHGLERSGVVADTKLIPCSTL